MSGNEGDETPGRRVARPWETTDEDAPPAPEADVDPEPDETESAGPPEDLSELGSGPTSLDDYSENDYLATTTREYQGLAESVAEADTQEFERQAVAAAIPGVGSGLIGFEDVTGEKGISEEEIEHVEQQRASDLTLRVGSALVLAVLFIGSVLVGDIAFSVFVGLAMVVALGEFYASVRSAGYTPLALFGLVGIIGVAIGSHAYGTTGLYGWVVGTVAAVAFYYTVVTRRAPLDNAGITILGLVWVSLLGFAIVIGRSDFAAPLILLIVLGTAAFDIGAFFIGKTFGRRKLAPSVSPNKTVEGLIGGIVASASLLAVLSTFPYFDPLDVTDAGLFALAICVLAPVGDAAESVVKRAIGVKDMGSIMPGHGGLLDRIDALLFVVPAAYYLFEGLGYL